MQGDIHDSEMLVNYRRDQAARLVVEKHIDKLDDVVAARDLLRLDPTICAHLGLPEARGMAIVLLKR